MQALMLLHMGDNAFEKHEHDGIICDVYLSVEHEKLAIANDVTFITEDVKVSEVKPSIQSIYFVIHPKSTYSRAPPHLS